MRSDTSASVTGVGSIHPPRQLPLGSAIQIAIEPTFVLEVLILAVVVGWLLTRKR